MYEHNCRVTDLYYAKVVDPTMLVALIAITADYIVSNNRNYLHMKKRCCFWIM